MKTKISIVILFAMFVIAWCPSCNQVTQNPVSDSGVKKVTATVSTNSDGQTVEQKNIFDRYDMDDDPGAIKHLYVISAYSGDVIIYSTVMGKVTSSGKRLSPITVNGTYDGMTSSLRNYVMVGNKKFTTDEVIQDDGTYGSSIPYLYWFDSKGIFHKHFVSGGQILHISSQPIVVPKIILNFETTE